MRNSGQSRHNGRRQHLVRLKAGEEAGRFAVVLFLQDVIDRIGRMAWMAHREVACIPRVQNRSLRRKANGHGAPLNGPSFEKTLESSSVRNAALLNRSWRLFPTEASARAASPISVACRREIGELLTAALEM